MQNLSFVAQSNSGLVERGEFPLSAQDRLSKHPAQRKGSKSGGDAIHLALQSQPLQFSQTVQNWQLEETLQYYSVYKKNTFDCVPSW